MEFLTTSFCWPIFSPNQAILRTLALRSDQFSLDIDYNMIIVLFCLKDTARSNFQLSVFSAPYVHFYLWISYLLFLNCYLPYHLFNVHKLFSGHDKLWLKILVIGWQFVYKFASLLNYDIFRSFKIKLNDILKLSPLYFLYIVIDYKYHHRFN